MSGEVVPPILNADEVDALLIAIARRVNWPEIARRITDSHEALRARVAELETELARLTRR